MSEKSKNDNDNNISTNKLVDDAFKLFKDTPSYVVIIIIIYIFTTSITSKLDVINETLMVNRTLQEKIIERLEEEEKDTKIFIEQQDEMEQDLKDLVRYLQ